MGSGPKILRYILKIFTYLLIPYIVGFIILKIFKEYWFPLYPYMIVLFMAMGIPVFFALKKLEDVNTRKFINSFLITAFFKLMLSILLIVLYVWFEEDSAIPFVITYFVFYIVLSICEIRIFKLKSSGKEIELKRDVE